MASRADAQHILVEAYRLISKRLGGRLAISPIPETFSAWLISDEDTFLAFADEYGIADELEDILEEDGRTCDEIAKELSLPTSIFGANILGSGLIRNIAPNKPSLGRFRTEASDPYAFVPLTRVAKKDGRLSMEALSEEASALVSATGSSAEIAKLGDLFSHTSLIRRKLAPLDYPADLFWEVFEAGVPMQDIIA